MDAVWATNAPTPADVLARLNDGRAQALAYTTVMTILVRLVQKGYLDRKPDGRRFRYSARVGPDELEQVAGRRDLDRILRRYGAANVARFAADLVPDDHEVMARLRDLAERDDAP
ncbi:BlaI/MecI/CopY family transcriptional regulator [soil metagenome]